LIPHAFADPGLLEQALSHRSAGSPHNERLEFLGDALLGAIAAEALFQRWPRADEGLLTRARAELVRESTLAAVARGLQLGQRLVLGPGELKTGGHRRESILADALEAVVAAIYLDAGLDACRSFVLSWMEPLIEALPPKLEKDAKTRLQEWLQGRRLPLPAYRLLEVTGEEHDQRFRVECRLESPPLTSEGEAGSRRAAEQLAASEALARLRETG
jgi:ribonuclease III